MVDIETIPCPSVGYDGDDFPPPVAHKVACIGVGEFDSQKNPIEIRSRFGDDECAIVDEFWSGFKKTKPTLVTWNGRRFDVPTLLCRAMRYGVSAEAYYQKRDYDYRYSYAGHLDIADAFSCMGAGRMSTMHRAARMIGLPGKMEESGDKVDEMWANGEWDRVAQYCETDVLQTSFLWLRHEVTRGSISVRRYKEVALSLAKMSATRPHLQKVIDASNKGVLFGKGEQ